MPLPRVLLVGVIAIVLVVIVLWTMNLNFVGWVGAWISKEQVYAAGASIVAGSGVFLAWIYAIFPARRLPGPPAIRGFIFGMLVAALCIWGLPTVLAGTAAASEDMRHIADGSIQKGAKIERSEIPPFPTIGIAPPFAAFTSEKKWENKHDWEGRLAPFLIAFGLWGLVLGLCLDDPESHKKKKR